jgi:hypothetical protein
MFGHRLVRQLRASAYQWRRGWRAGGAAGPAGSGAPRGAPVPLQLQQARGVAAAAGAAGQVLTQLVQRAGLKLAGGFMVLGGGAGAFTVLTKEQQVELEATSATAKLPWVQALAGQPGMREVLVPGQQLRKHPVGQLVSEEDHLVSPAGGGRRLPCGCRRLCELEAARAAAAHARPPPLTRRRPLGRAAAELGRGPWQPWASRLRLAAANALRGARRRHPQAPLLSAQAPLLSCSPARAPPLCALRASPQFETMRRSDQIRE